MHILIVEDEQMIAENLYDFLEACGHQCDFAATLAGARSLLAKSEFDALVLDRNLPDGDGAGFASALRESGKSLPILMLTAKDTLDDKLAGFAAGADDYLVKPFALKEVEVRLLSLQRRAAGRVALGVLALGPLALDLRTQTLTLAGALVSLPPKSMRLLEALLQSPGEVLSRQTLEHLVWGESQVSSDNLRSALHTIRKGLGSASGLEIMNVHGIGYKLVCH